ncbi:MAG: Mini-ribonuclease 3 [Dehalobacterium sp.]|jgi:ribonuclease-3 family protein
MAAMNKDDIVIQPKQLPALTLAYIGDAVYELWVRKHLIHQGCVRVNALHHQAIKYVNAAAQSELMGLLEPILDDQELRIFKKGRNAKSGRQPKNMDMIDYRRATGLEALVGYLYLLNKQEKLEQIFTILVEMVEKPGT